MPVTVIIPTLNEQDWITASVRSAIAAGAGEVIVADGGSTDHTTRHAKAEGARVMLTDRMRSRQLNRAAEAAANEAIVFLHADTLLPPGAAAAVENALADAAFGGFRVAFAEGGVRLRYVAMMINLRTAITRCPWGDQAQFIRRDALRSAGGFREIPIMEDYDLAVRMRRAGRTRILPLTVVTSGRRFLRKGVLRTSLTNWRIIALYHRGRDAEDLARLYRG